MKTPPAERTPAVPTQPAVDQRSRSGLALPAPQGAAWAPLQELQGLAAGSARAAPATQLATLAHTGSAQRGNPAPIQFTLAHANLVVDRYNHLGTHTPPLPHYTRAAGIHADYISGRITPPQFDMLRRAYNLQTNGQARPVDHQGVQINRARRRDPAMMAGAAIMAALSTEYPNHYAVMTWALGEVLNRFGPAAESEFWKGGHIVFNDNGDICNTLFHIAKPIAKLDSAGQLMSKTEFVGLTGHNYFGLAAIAKEQRAGKMMARHPGRKETSHYADLTRHPNPLNVPPQYGIDMPEAIGGHLLFGLDYNGNTFLQTEGAGFQSFKEASLKHGQGFITLKAHSLQTGMTGTSTRSEQGATPSHLDEADNLAVDSINIIINSII